MKRQLRCHETFAFGEYEAKRTPFPLRAAKPRFIGRSPASFFMHRRCASFSRRAGYANPHQSALHFDCVRIVGSPKKDTAFAVSFFGDPSGNRTHVYAVRGRRLSRLTIGPYSVDFGIISHTAENCKPFSAFFSKKFLSVPFYPLFCPSERFFLRLRYLQSLFFGVSLLYCF